MFLGIIQSLISCASEYMILLFMHTLFFEIHEFISCLGTHFFPSIYEISFV